MPFWSLTRGSANSADDAGVSEAEEEVEDETEARRRAEGRGREAFKGGAGSVASGVSSVVVVSRQSGELLRRREGGCLGVSALFDGGPSPPSWSWSSGARSEPRSDDRDSRGIAQWAKGLISGHAGAERGERARGKIGRKGGRRFDRAQKKGRTDGGKGESEDGGDGDD